MSDNTVKQIPQVSDYTGLTVIDTAYNYIFVYL